MSPGAMRYGKGSSAYAGDSAAAVAPAGIFTRFALAIGGRASTPARNSTPKTSALFPDAVDHDFMQLLLRTGDDEPQGSRRSARRKTSDPGYPHALGSGHPGGSPLSGAQAAHEPGGRNGRSVRSQRG